ncbi:hypothetical protein [Paraburkholderia phosphatilytica]|uniref:hypothetical protein n=1 Tax=Paraburkholderia phosphatilytica TaxID=2282883 RepID=UPI000E5356D7|nr:hypothetical protein [Paraburkholderia phosphatilytica]
MKFDPEKTRESKLRRDGALLKFLLNTQYDSKRPMGNVAQSQIGEVIGAWLVGLHEDVFPVIHRSNEWLDRAIKEDEDFGVDKNFHRRTLHWARGVGEWLETGWNAESSWDKAREFEEATWRNEQRPWPMNEIIEEGLDDYMAFAFQAADDCSPDGLERYERGIQMYEHWLGKEPPIISKTLKPREFAYALCLHYTRSHFSRDELFQAGRRMLGANLETKWFGAGQFTRGATWLKIVYRDFNDTLTPLQTILKAYDDMPHVKRPEFVGR